MNLRLSFAALAALGLAVTACGPTTGGATPTPTHTAGGPTSGPPSTPTATPTPSADGQYPATDTPYLSLSAAQQQVWRDYASNTLVAGGPNNTPVDSKQAQAATIVPGKEIFAGPAMPKVTNLTNGGLSDADATKLGALYWKDEQLLNWGAAKGQFGVLAFSQCTYCADPPVIAAMEKGEPVTEQACNVFARAISVIPVTPAIQNWFNGELGPTAGKYALLLTYDFSSDCGYTISGQAPFTGSQSSNYHEILGGTEIVDPALGGLFLQDAISGCDKPSPVASYCG